MLSLAAVPALGSVSPTPLEALLQALRNGRTGEVVGRAYVERLMPSGPDVPLGDLGIALWPFSAGLMTDLEKIKADSRRSLSTHRQSAPRMERMLESYEQSLWESGGADVLLSAAVRPDGTFQLSAVPAGQWLLVARRRETAGQPPPAQRRARIPLMRPGSDAAFFAPSAETVGYSLLRLWLRPVDMAAENVVTIEITDRNVWYTGVVEEAVTRKEGPPKFPAGR